MLELDESPEQGVSREVWQETGIHVEVDQLTGVYKNTGRGIVEGHSDSGMGGAPLAGAGRIVVSVVDSRPDNLRPRRSRAVGW